MHLGGVIVRDLSIKVSNYRSNISLDEYLKKQAEAQFAVPEADMVKAVRDVLARHRA